MNFCGSTRMVEQKPSFGDGFNSHNAGALFIYVFFILSLLAGLSASTHAADLDWLTKTAPRPAGMGGAFAAVSGDPMSMWWNPAAALHNARPAISGSHSLRHFPGARRDLDQFDSDLVGLTLPLAGSSAAGAAFNMVGEWGLDHADTNGVVPDGEVVRGRERRIAVLPNDNNHSAAAIQGEASWYRASSPREGAAPRRSFPIGIAISFYYQGAGGASYGVNLRGVEQRKTSSTRAFTVTTGVAYRRGGTSDALAAFDVEYRPSARDNKLNYFGGVEQSIDDHLFLRAGSMAGKFTYGAGLGGDHFRMDYAVVRGLLPRVTERPDIDKFQDGHFLSYMLRR